MPFNCDHDLICNTRPSRRRDLRGVKLRGNQEVISIATLCRRFAVEVEALGGGYGGPLCNTMPEWTWRRYRHNHFVSYQLRTLQDLQGTLKGLCSITQPGQVMTLAVFASPVASLTKVLKRLPLEQVILTASSVYFDHWTSHERYLAITLHSPNRSKLKLTLDRYNSDVWNSGLISIRCRFDIMYCLN